MFEVTLRFLLNSNCPEFVSLNLFIDTWLERKTGNIKELKTLELNAILRQLVVTSDASEL